MKEAIQQIIQDNAGWFAGILVILITSLFQWLSKSFKPWSWLFKQFGKAINQDVLENQKQLEKKIDTVSQKVDNLEKRVEANDSRDAEDKALEARRRILRCGDEIRMKERHSEEYFNDVLNDIKTYKNYCREHPGFENDKAVISMKIIEEAYHKCIKENDFL